MAFLIAGICFAGEGAVDMWTGSRFMFWLGCVLLLAGTLQVVSFVVSKRSDRALKVSQSSRLLP